MGHNVHGINLYGVIMTLMGNLHAGGQSNLGHLSLLHPHQAHYVNSMEQFAMQNQYTCKRINKKILQNNNYLFINLLISCPNTQRRNIQKYIYMWWEDLISTQSHRTEFIP